MPTLYEGIGLEELVDSIETVFRSKLNAAIEAQQAKWDPRDEARAAAREEEYVRCELEPITDDAIYVGHIPSLVLEESDLSVDSYPYVAITPDDTAPDPEDARQDQINVHQNMLAIHAVAKANAAEGPEFAFRRAARMAEAIYATVVHDRQLGRMLQGVSNPTRVRLSEPFTFNPEGHGQDWYWQAAGTQYSIKNYARPPEEV